MKYTVKSFIQYFCGDLSHLAGDNCYLVFNENSISIQDDDYVIDDVTCSKIRGVLYINLLARNCWNLELQFSDKGLIKNKRYYLKDYLAKDKLPKPYYND